VVSIMIRPISPDNRQPSRGSSGVGDTRAASWRAATREGSFPLSPMQYGMLLHSADTPGTGVYVLQLLVTVRDAMDLPRFEQALRELVGRHAALRTSFWLDDPDGPSQTEHTDVDVVLPVQDLRRYQDTATRLARVREYLDADKTRPFNGGDRPPMRFVVIRVADEEYRFVWTCHHALMDGRSCVAVVAELFGQYDRMLSGGTPQPLPTRRPYADYVRWLSAQDHAGAEEFWREHLAGVTGSTPLALDSVRQLDVGEMAFAATGIELTKETTERLYARADEHRVTANNFVQAAWAVLLHRLSGRRDVLFGTARACRSFSDDADAMIGMFVNMLPLRVIVHPDMTVVELLRRLRHDQMTLRSFEHASPAQIHRWAGISTSGPLFESVVTFENYQYGTYFRSLGGGWKHRDASYEGYTSYPLSLYAYRDKRLVLDLGYDRRRFADSVPPQLLANLRILLDAMTSAPHTTLAELPGLEGIDITPSCSPAPEDTRAWWVERLATLEPLCLPVGDGRPGAPRSYDTVRLQVPEGLAEDARAEWLLTAILTFLARYTGEDGRDVEVRWPVRPVVGTRWDDRSAPYLPFRVPAITDGPDIAEFQEDVKRQLELLAEHGAVPPDVWARHSQLRAHSSLAGDGLPIVIEQVPDLATPAVTRAGTVLLVQIPRDGDSCRLLVSRDARLGGTAPALAHRLATYLRAGAASAGTAVTRLPLMPEHERRRVLVDCNDTAVDHPLNECVHHIFMRQARRRPHAPALVFDGRTLSYGELDHRSTELAEYLGSHGAGPGRFVGVYFERSAEMVVTLLAVMKTGAAFVPLDPIYPPERVARIVTASGISLLLTQASLVGDVQGLPTRVLVLDGARQAIGHVGGHHCDRVTPQQHSAYLISTSGSTGQPKIVDVTHRGLTNVLCSLARTLGLNEDDQFLAVTTVCFDMAYVELFLPLVTGGRVEVVSQRATMDGFELRRRVDDSRPTVMQATPATWRMLIAAGWTGDRRVTALCGGEALSRDLADGLLDRVGRLWNVYGPTETTIFSSVAAVARDQPITIGLPVDNTQLFVLDPWQQPVPPGMPGELYIGGDGVAAGYLGDPDLTRTRFVRSPLSGGGRMYRTGDRVRRLPDGRVEFLDRLDEQVKVHGYRVEPREIAAELRKYPGVAETVVVAREDAPGVRRLVGYLTAVDRDRPPSTAELRSHLMATLPRYMVPTALVTVPQLPRTPNGKIDHRALPRPTDLDLLPTGATRVAPRTPTEQAIAAIWCNVLGLVVVGIDDNFLDVGGDSLLLMHVTTRLRAEFDESLSRVDMFMYPTIRAMAGHLDRARGDGAPEEATRAAADGAVWGRTALHRLRQRRSAGRQPQRRDG
jgi:amino acid adenylation domain-containing protein